MNTGRFFEFARDWFLRVISGVGEGEYLKRSGNSIVGATPAGAGDMLQATYDTDASGVVDLAEGMVETGGPTSLAMGAVADGEYLKRNGATVVGGAPSGYTPGVGHRICMNMMTDEPASVGQGTWSAGRDSNYFYCGRFLNNTHNDGDNFTMNFSVPAGTYKLRCNTAKSSNRGILKIYTDTVNLQGTFDLYAAALDATNISEVNGIVLSEGDHTITFTVDGKNGSSSDHYVSIEGISLERTA